MPKTVLITGAGSGFGHDAAIQLAGRGHSVIATVATERQAAELAAAHPELTVAKLDITKSDDVATVDRWDLDVLIANAGRGQTGPLASIPMARLRAVFEVHSDRSVKRRYPVVMTPAPVAQAGSSNTVTARRQAVPTWRPD